MEILDIAPPGFPGYVTEFRWNVFWYVLRLGVIRVWDGWPTRDAAAPEEDG